MGSYSERLDQSLKILENVSFDSTDAKLHSTLPSKSRRSPKISFECEKHALSELSILLTNLDSLGAVGNQQISREKLSRAISVLFQFINHPEQSLRFLADQILDEIFRKFVLKFQAPKVIAYLLTELDKKKSPGRLICSILQRLSWVAVYTRAQRAEVYNAHFLCGMIQCIQSQDDSIQQAIQRYFPVIFDYFGPFISASHTERATELFNATMKNLSSGGVKNRAASTVISCLAKFVPSILHKSFYQLSDIILQGGDDDEQHQHELAGALNTLSFILPFVLENMNQNLAFMLKKLLCRVLCCLYSRGNEVVLASLEFLQKFVSKHQQFRDSIQQLAQFDPLFVQMLGSAERSSLKSDIYCVDEQRPSCSKCFEKELEEVETMSCFSMRTGYSLSRPASAWNSLQDLLAEQKMLGLNLDEQASDEPEQRRKTVDDAEENYQKIDENLLENDDNVSVSSAELFVDPLMNCLHQQQKSIGNSSWSLSQKSKNLKSNDGTLSMRTRTNTTSGLLTPISIISRSVGQKSFEDQQYTSSAVSSEENQGILEFLPDNFCNTGVNFWIYSSLFVAKNFLLAGKGRIRSNREIRVSQKIIALNYISDSLLMENSTIHQPIFDSDGQQYSLLDLHLYIGNDDDNLAIASLNFFFNVEKCCFFNDPSQFAKLFVEKSKLIWYLKKTLHCQRNSNRLKGIFQIFINSISFLCSTESLLLASCEYAINADADIDYFRVKAVRVEFISKIKWSYTSPQIRQKLLNEFCRVFLVQLFDKDPRVQKATLDALPLFVLNIDLGHNTNIFAPFSLPHCLESHSPLPVIIGLTDKQHSFFQTKICDENFFFIFNKIYSLTMDQFFDKKSAFISALEVLINNFPQNYFSLINERTSRGITKESRSLTNSQKDEMPSVYSMFLLLLDFAENVICSLDEFGVVIRLITKLFSAISTILINQNSTLNNSSTLLQLWNLCQTNTENAQQPPKSKLPNTNCIERCLLLYLRTLNLFYSIVAEEKVRRHKLLLHRTGLIAEGFVSNAAFLLSNPSSLILPEKSDYFSTTAKSLLNTTSPNAKAINLSFLLGSSTSHGRRQLTSYSNSIVLTSLEMHLRNSYKSFLESLKPDLHSRFLDLFNSTMDGFCTFLEFADFSLIRPFIDELVIFLRILMDISPENSARLVSQLIKSAFNINYFSLRPIPSNPLCQPKIWEELTDCIKAAPLELFKFVQSFNTFVKFSHRSEFSSMLLEEMAGWMHSNRMKLPLVTIVDETQQEQMNRLLHQFEPFLSHLLKLYPLTNSNRTRKSILECIFILCLCNVRYELLDANGRFKSKIISQLKQLSPEDAPILPSMFIFVLLVVRVRCLKFSEIGLVIEQLFSRMDHKICYWSLEAFKIIIFDILSQCSRKSRISEDHKRILMLLKDGLLKIFSMTFQFFPEASAEVWICLLHAFRDHFDSESLSIMSLDFITHYLKFYEKMAVSGGEFATPQNSPTRETTPQIDANEQYSFLNGHSSIKSNLLPNPTRQLFLHSALISQCIVSTEFKIDNFLNCLNGLLKQLVNDSEIFNNSHINLALHICPLIFVLFNHIDEEKLLNFWEAQKLDLIEENINSKNLEELPKKVETTYTDFIAKSIVHLLFRIENYICSETFIANDGDLQASKNHICHFDSQATLLFLIFTIQQTIKSAKSSHLSSSLKKHLCISYTSLSKNVYVKLAHISPSIWSFWMNLQFIVSNEISFGDFDALPSKCKSFLVQLLYLKIFAIETESDAETLFISILDSLKLSSSKADFLLEFLRTRDEKMFKKCLNKLPKRILASIEMELIQVFCQNWGEDVFIPNIELSSLIPRLFCILAKSENQQIINLLTRINEIPEFNSYERFKVIWAHFSNKPEQTFTLPTCKFTSKEFSILHDNNVSITQFYKTLLLHAAMPDDFKQIIEGILTLSEEEIGGILEARPPWPLSKRFFECFFLVLIQSASNYDMLEDDNNYTQRIEKIIQVLFELLLNTKDKRKCFAAENVFILAKIDELWTCFRLQFSEQLFSSSSNLLERFLNGTFIQLFSSYYSNDEELPSEYFVALKLFFSLHDVKEYFARNDCRTLKSLLLFLTLLWEHVEQQIPHWKRLNIDKRHWPVQIEIVSEEVGSCIGDYWQEEEREELEEAIKKVFVLVQRIVFSLKNDLLKCEETNESFTALLANVSLFHRMALVPESALRLDWQLLISVNIEGNCFIPLIQIHLLNDYNVLQDFCFRIFSFGWSSRSQFEEYSMSLFGVLSSTPTTLTELQQRTESDGINAAHQQLSASSLAVEALSCVLLQSLLYPKPGDLVDSFFVVIHRKRGENYLFLDTEPGKIALRAKFLTNLLIENGQVSMSNQNLFIENLECVDSRPGKQYGLGQAALYHLWSVTGLLESSASKDVVEASTFYTTHDEAESSSLSPNELLNDECDTASSLRALFETFMHWLNSSGSISHLPLSILHSTLRSLSLLSDLFQEKAFYIQTFSTIKSLLANNPFLFTDPTCKGYSYYLLLKCASVLDWMELADSGEVSTAKYIEGIIHSGFLQQDDKFVQNCSLHGLLYLSQSLALDNLHNIMSISFDFVVKELKQLRQEGINSLDCFIFNQKLCWAFAFGILQEAVPLSNNSRDEFLQLVKLMFIDPHLPDWLKSVLTHGIESLVLHSCSYASNFRQIALEYFDTYQLQPGHLPYALSIYFTCAYRELNEGGEFTYAFNKSFGEDFLKILNIFSFFSNSPIESKVLSMYHLISDLISFVWAKEVVLECIWTVLMPPLTPIASPRKPTSLPVSSQNDTSDQRLSTDFSDPLQYPSESYSISDNKPLFPQQLILSKFDQFLVQLIFFILRRLYKTDKKVCYELLANFLIPKLMNRIENSAEMIKYLTLILLCSTTNNEANSKRVHFLFRSNPFDSEFFKAIFHSDYINKLIKDFLDEFDSLKLVEDQKRSELLEFFLSTFSINYI